MPIYQIHAFYIAPDETSGVLTHQWDESPLFALEPGPEGALRHAPATMAFDHWIQEIKADYAARNEPFALERAELWDEDVHELVLQRGGRA
jgi:hypothetical protein